MEPTGANVSKPPAAAPAPGAPAKIPMKIPMKMPMKMPMPGLAMKRAVPAPAAAPAPLAGAKRAAAAAPAAAPPSKKIRRSPSPSSSDSSDSDSDSSSYSSSDSSSGSYSSSSGSASSSRSSSVSIPANDEPTFFDLARQSGLVNTAVLEQEPEEAAPEGPPPRPPIVRSFPTDIDKALERYKERLNREENAIQIKDDNKAVSLGTSKINYIDPRIVTSWAKAQNVPVNKVFSATIIKKFPWAMDAENYDF